jgi:hypothetical protein
VLSVWCLFQVAAALWDLPGSWGWENDAVAPRDFFAGIGTNLTPGQGHRYPLLHNLLVGLVCAPVLIFAALPTLMDTGFDAESLRSAVLAVGPMTACSVLAKLLTVTMSAVGLLALARISRRTFSLQSARWTLLLAATCISVAYYGRTSNLDMPYVMWTLLALDRLLTVIERGDRRSYRWMGLFVAAAVATKDQAYASFVLVLPLYLLAWPLLRRDALAARSTHWRYLLESAAIALLGYGLLGGGLLNPSGFLTRIDMLIGPASEDWRAYDLSATGIGAQLADLGRNQSRFWWPWPLVAAGWMGIPIALLRNGEPCPRIVRLLPLVAMASFLTAFTLVVGRAEHRFVLPIGLGLAVYGGVTLDTLVRRLGRAGYGLATLLIAHAALNSFQLHLTQWGDARREVLRSLATLPPDSVVETYGHTVYQPHFETSPSSSYRCRRVGPIPLGRRNPLVGCREVLGAWADAVERRPDAIVLTHWARRFETPARAGRPTSSAMTKDAHDATSRDFFQDALEDQLPGYRVELRAEPQLPAWAVALGAKPVRIHGSTGTSLTVLRRSGD